MGRNDDDAWRAIVDNYGDRAELDPAGSAGSVDGGGFEDEGSFESEEPASTRGYAEDPDDRFVPPEPPPLPRPPRDRALAWAGLFGSPAVILAFVVLGRRPPGLLSYALVAAFVGGFLYLVLRMNREPRDPWDDGAQL